MNVLLGGKVSKKIRRRKEERGKNGHEFLERQESIRAVHRTNKKQTFISVGDLQISNMAPDMISNQDVMAISLQHEDTTENILIRRRIPAQNIQNHPRMHQRLSAIISLHQTNHLRRQLALLLQSANLQTSKEAERRLGLRVYKLLLDELERGERALELMPLECVCARAVDAVFEGAHDAPGYSVSTKLAMRNVKDVWGTGHSLDIPCGV